MLKKKKKVNGSKRAKTFTQKKQANTYLTTATHTVSQGTFLIQLFMDANKQRNQIPNIRKKKTKLEIAITEYSLQWTGQ